MKTTPRETTLQNRKSSPQRRNRLLATFALATALGLAGRAAADDCHDLFADYCGAEMEFDTSLTSFAMNGGPFEMPLASDPGNVLFPDSVSGFGFVRSQVSISLSSQRSVNPGPASLGKAFAVAPLVIDLAAFAEADTWLAGGGHSDTGPVRPNELQGRATLVYSIFDIFFDITVTDVDARPGRNFAGQPDGASFTLLDNGPARMASIAGSPYVANPTLIYFDKDAPNYGLLPPPGAAPYLGHFNIVIPLGGDINGNGINDKIKFTLVTHSVDNGSITYVTLPDGTVLDSFDSAAVLQGAVVDETTDPPFTIGRIDPLTGLPDGTSFGGPVTATSRLTTPVIPEPSQALLALLGGAATLARRRRTR